MEIVDGLFTYHVVGWKKIPPNRVEGKLYPFYIHNSKCKIKKGVFFIIIFFIK